MANVDLSGELRDKPFARLVAELVRAKATGALVIQDPIGINKAFFVNGVPQGARLSRLKHPIGRILVDDGHMTEEQLNEALAAHSRTEKLIGQILLDMKLVDKAMLDAIMARQSQLNFLSLFGLHEGAYEFHNGLVEITDFQPAPMPTVEAMYLGVRNHGSPDVANAMLAELCFLGFRLKPGAELDTERLGPAENQALALLASYKTTPELGRALPLQPRAIGALLFALSSAGALETAPLAALAHAGSLS